MSNKIDNAYNSFSNSLNNQKFNKQISNNSFNDILGRMQNMMSQAQGINNANYPASGIKDIGEIFVDGINKFSNTEIKTGQLEHLHLKGDPSVSLPQVVIAGKNLKFYQQMASAGQNYLISGFKEIMNYQV